METKIFYFSTTGNSLALARKISGALDDAELVSIPKAKYEPAEINSSRLGFIFPVHAWGLPYSIVEFFQGLKIKGKPYVFAVATCGGNPGRTLFQLQKLLRKAGADFHAGFVCREEANTVTDDLGFVRFANRLNRIRYPSGNERLPEILKAIRDKSNHKMETSSFAANLFGALMHGFMSLAADKLKSFDSSYYVDDRCASCRTCERICPRANITVEDGKSVWHHNCEMCYACIQWCPQQVIHIANETRRYHNPSVLAEELRQR